MILYTWSGQDRQKHTTNHQRAEQAIWIVCLVCGVVHPKALFAWIWLEEGIKQVVCSPLASVLLFATVLWCIEKPWLGYPLQTQEIPLFWIMFNKSLTIHWTWDPYFKLCSYCLPVNWTNLSDHNAKTFWQGDRDKQFYFEIMWADHMMGFATTSSLINFCFSVAHSWLAGVSPAKIKL